jgi:hypothetical protein
MAVRAGSSPTAGALAAILGDPERDRRLWAALAPLPWAVRGAVAKPGAEVLLVAADGGRDPLVASARMGAGRVLWLGSDATWRWRDPLADRVHRTFWSQALRWGLGARLRGREQRLQVSIDRAVVPRGEAVELRIRVRDAALRPLAVAPAVAVAPVAGDGPSQRIEAEAQDDGTWRARLAGLAAGGWKLTVNVDHPDLAADREVRELVVQGRDAREEVELAADGAALARGAAAGGGEACAPAEAEGLLAAMAAQWRPRSETRRRTWSLWSGPWPLLPITVLLTLEWWLRRRHGLP